MQEDEFRPDLHAKDQSEEPSTAEEASAEEAPAEEAPAEEAPTEEALEEEAPAEEPQRSEEEPETGEIPVRVHVPPVSHQPSYTSEPQSQPAPGPVRRRPPWRQYVALALVFLLIGGLLGAAAMKEYNGLYIQLPNTRPGTESGQAELPGVQPEGTSKVPLPTGTTDEQQRVRVVAATIHSVVQVLVSKTVKNAYSLEPSTVLIGSGSGFVYDTKGHIITNNHVVEEGDIYTVELPGGDRLEATLVGTDRLTDLAVLEVTNLPDSAKPLPLADSSNLQVGQTAIAIGSPMTSGSDEFGLGRTPTVTSGMVSAVDRSMPVMSDQNPNVVDFRIENLIQTDAAINHGNSGGPLLNSQGEVIGVNTAIIPSTQGIGFAIPSNVVSNVAPELISKGKVERPYLGVQFQDLGLVLSSNPNLDVPVKDGALILEITPDGPADKAGLRATTFDQRGALDHLGDIIVAINGVAVNGNNMASQILEYQPGDKITVTYYRGNDKAETTVTLESR